MYFFTTSVNSKFVFVALIVCSMFVIAYKQLLRAGGAGPVGRAQAGPTFWSRRPD